jgi:hypothetical protein
MRVLSAFALLLVASASTAQTLGEVARQEAARRGTVKAPGKVYTNDQLKPDPGVATLAPPAAGTPGDSTAPGKPEAGAPKGDSGKADPGQADPQTGEASARGSKMPAATDEKGWRAKVQAARDALSRAQLFAEALQSRINGLSADFTARDDPQQRAAVAADQQKSLDELARVKKEIEELTKGIAEIQEAGRRAGVPAGWLR